ncbi:ABC transporter ATP-binding protein [Azospirillum agricola]|uniref:ABC transporter ATP-binding protein n=1 Tax=Azospirillum agricola TaxID=1720247 RepID=UPI000A0F1B8C|nr:oligopeptide/dipeptide ABC transporter ATP-binding protein [Azospirillum agricola]SMH56129.1 peptide/nickel transport system ATP-binding protein [Azospirillum lipoferum]
MISRPVPPPVETNALTLLSGDRVLIDRATLAVGAGEVLAVTGGAGAGKSLLLRALAGLPLPGIDQAGSARVDGRRLLIAQGGMLAPRRPLTMQAAEIVGHHLGLDASASLRRVADALDRLGVPAAARRFDLPPDRLPDGLRWTALFALALAVGPAVLLADAPGAGLDPTVRLRLLHRLADWARGNAVALILAGRPEDGVAGPAGRVLALRRGRLLPAPPPLPSPVLVPRTGGTGAPLLSGRGVSVSFALGRTAKGAERRLTAVHAVDIDLAEGETVALLGETGSGKAMLARALAHLPAPSGGRVSWMGRDLAAADATGMRRVRRDLQILFPDPAASLDPAQTVGAQLAGTLESLRPDIPADRRARRIADALEEAGLRAEIAPRWPATLSATEAARVGLARALLPEPRALVCDEPAAALSAGERTAFRDDVLGLRDRRRLALLLATEQAGEGLRHADRGLVMLMGRVVESAGAGVLLNGARHPLTRAMLAAARGEAPQLDGEAPSALAAPDGCPLRPRCPNARSFCSQAVPVLEEIAPGHRVACHYWDTP